jgi:hypothetical protein
MRFGAVLDVAKQMEQANEAATLDNAQAQERARAAAEARHAAQLALRDALQAVTRAERDYRAAVLAAERDIAEARGRAKEAEADLADARRRANRSANDAGRRVKETQRDLKQAVKDAYVYWIELISEVRDDQLDLEGAQLSVLDAQVALLDAQRAYNQLLNEIPADKLGDVLQKLNDVNLPADQVQAFITAAMGADADPRYAEKLYKSSLKLKHAQHDLKVANEDVRDATYDLAKSQGELNTFTEKGVAAYEPYVDAVKANKEAKRDENRVLADNKRALTDATAKVREARRELRRYIEAGADTRQVQNAADAVRDANERLAEAQRRVRRAARDAGRGMDDQSAASIRLRQSLKELSPAEREVLYALVGRDGKGGLKRAFREAFSTDTVMHSMAGFIRGLSGLLRDLAPYLQPLAETWADIIDSAGKGIRGDGIRDFFKVMITSARILLRLGAGGFKDFLGAMAELARLATPGLIMVFGEFARTMGDLRSALQGQGAQRNVNVMIDSFRAWAGFIKDLLVGFGKLAIVLAPFGNEILDWLGKGAERLGEWAASAEGQKKIGDFMRDTLPLFKELAELIGQVVVAFLEFLQFVAPILTPIVDMIGDIVGMFGKFLGLLSRMIPRPIRELVGHFTSIFLLGPKIVSWLGKVPGLLGDILKFIGALGIVDAIVDGVEAAAEAVSDAAKAVGKAVVAGIKFAVEAGIDVGKWILDKLGDAASFGGKVLEWAAKGIASGAASVASAGGTVVGWLQNGLGAIAEWGGSILSAIKGSIERAAKATGKGAVSAGSAIASWILDGIKDAGAFGGRVLRWVRGAIAGAIRKGGGLVSSLGRWLLRGITSLGGFGASVLGWISRAIRGALGRAANIGSAIARGIWNGIKGAFSLGSRLVGWLKSGLRGVVSVGRDIADWLWQGIKGLPSMLLNGIRGAINSVIRGWNNLRFSIGSVKVLGETVFPGVTINTPDLPLLAKGGIARSATAAIFGEAGDEAVLPLTDEVLAKLGAAIFDAASRSMPSVTVDTSPVATVTAPRGPRPPDDPGMQAYRRSEHHEHLHVHGHERKVDPDPRTTEALQERRRRRRGASRP